MEMLEKDGDVVTEVIPDRTSKSLMPHIRDHVGKVQKSIPTNTRAITSLIAPTIMNVSPSITRKKNMLEKTARQQTQSRASFRS